MGGNLSNDSRVKQQQAASDQRQLPRNQEKQGAKYPIQTLMIMLASPVHAALTRRVSAARV